MPLLPRGFAAAVSVSLDVRVQWALQEALPKDLSNGEPHHAPQHLLWCCWLQLWSSSLQDHPDHP
jgi:hypothetical protein